MCILQNILWDTRYPAKKLSVFCGGFFSSYLLSIIYLKTRVTPEGLIFSILALPPITLKVEQTFYKSLLNCIENSGRATSGADEI